jgi:hypothetical protein
MPVPAHQVKNVNKWRAGIIEAAQGDKIIKYCLILLRTKKEDFDKNTNKDAYRRIYIANYRPGGRRAFP